VQEISSLLSVDIHTARLVGGKLYNQGRVEVYYNDEWGTVCHHGWDNTDASVVCRQLGLGASGRSLPFRSYYNNYNFEMGSGSIILSNVVCSSYDHTLAACGHSGVGITYYCDHHTDAGVICDGMCCDSKMYFC